MYKICNSKDIQLFWGSGTDSDRLNAIYKYTPKGVRILDIGTGRGAFTEALNLNGFSTIGVDSYHYPEWDNKPQQWFIQANADNLPFSDKEFHTTILFEVLEHCSNPCNVLKEIVRCTSQHLIMSVPNCDLNNALRRYDLALAHWTDQTHCNFFTKDSIVNLLNEANLKVIEISDCYKISPNNYFWETIRLPRIIAKIGQKLCDKFNLAETYWSAILIVAEVP